MQSIDRGQCGVLVGVNANDTGERDKFRTLLALKRKEVQKIMRDAKQRREKDKNFVRAMMSKTIALQNCLSNQRTKQQPNTRMEGSLTFPWGNHLPSEVVRRRQTDLLQLGCRRRRRRGSCKPFCRAPKKCRVQIMVRSGLLLEEQGGKNSIKRPHDKKYKATMTPKRKM